MVSVALDDEPVSVQLPPLPKLQASVALAVMSTESSSTLAPVTSMLPLPL